MKQIKLFYNTTPRLEEEVNSFCKDVYVVDIKPAQSTHSDGTIAVMIMVIYETYINANITDKRIK